MTSHCDYIKRRYKNDPVFREHVISKSKQYYYSHKHLKKPEFDTIERACAYCILKKRAPFKCFACRRLNILERDLLKNHEH
jgi:hypothetical protein